MFKQNKEDLLNIILDTWMIKHPDHGFTKEIQDSIKSRVEEAKLKQENAEFYEELLNRI